MHIPKNKGVYYPDPGIFKDLKCGICNEKMDVKRNQETYSSWDGMSNNGKKRKNDYFLCFNIHEKWHLQAILLLNGSQTFGGGVGELSRMLTRMAKEIIDKKMTTKEMWGI